MVLIAVSIPSLHADLTDPQYYHVDTRGVVAWLQDHATTQDIVLVDQRYPFGFYWERWDSSAHGLPPAEPADQPPAQYLFVDLNQVHERLTELAGDAQYRLLGDLVRIGYGPARVGAGTARHARRAAG